MGSSPNPVVAPLMPWLALSTVLAPSTCTSPIVGRSRRVAHSHFAPHGHRDDELSTPPTTTTPNCRMPTTCGLDRPRSDSEATRHFRRCGRPCPRISRSFPHRLVRVAVIPDEATLPHGPPRVPTSLRAPPFACLDLFTGRPSVRLHFSVHSRCYARCGVLRHVRGDGVRLRRAPIADPDQIRRRGAARGRPRVRAMRAGIDIARADVLTAARWPNPRVTYDRESVAGVTEHIAMVAQPLPITGGGEVPT